jgi:pimeloyl-ACP methyl ester carboxylesterase
MTEQVVTFALIPGAASGPQYWAPLAEVLRTRGHRAVPVDLPCDDETRGLEDYVAAAVEAIGRTTRLVVVAHSLGGFTAPLLCEHLPVELLVLVQAMVPLPGERACDWWGNTAHAEALRALGFDSGDVTDTFMHDLSPAMREAALSSAREQAERPTADPWPLATWPNVPTRFVLCTKDRFFPEPFMRRVVADRLRVTPDEIHAGHLPMLSAPRELADVLTSYLPRSRDE